MFLMSARYAPINDDKVFENDCRKKKQVCQDAAQERARVQVLPEAHSQHVSRRVEVYLGVYLPCEMTGSSLGKGSGS